MSKRVNNKSGNQAKWRQYSDSNTKVRAGYNPEKMDSAGRGLKVIREFSERGIKHRPEWLNKKKPPREFVGDDERMEKAEQRRERKRLRNLRNNTQSRD